MIVVVDDDVLWSRYVEKLMPHREFTLAPTSTDGLVACYMYQPSVILLDVYLPDGMGSDLIGCFLHAAPGAAIIMISTENDVAEATRGIMAGAIASCWKGDRNLLPEIISKVEQRPTPRPIPTRRYA